MIQHVIDCAPHAVGMTSTTCKGVSFMNRDLFGAWSNCFLAQLRSTDSKSGELAAAFFAAHKRIAQTFGRAVDQPCFFARTATLRIDTNAKVNRQPRRGEFPTADWI